MRIDIKKVTVVNNETQENSQEICLICGRPGAFEGLCDSCYFEEQDAADKITKKEDEDNSK